MCCCCCLCDGGGGGGGEWCGAERSEAGGVCGQVAAGCDAGWKMARVLYLCVLVCMTKDRARGGGGRGKAVGCGQQGRGSGFAVICGRVGGRESALPRGGHLRRAWPRARHASLSGDDPVKVPYRTVPRVPVLCTAEGGAVKQALQRCIRPPCKPPPVPDACAPPPPPTASAVSWPGNRAPPSRGTAPLWRTTRTRVQPGQLAGLVPTQCAGGTSGGIRANGLANVDSCLATTSRGSS